jgi:hypothetical protein
LVETAAGEFEVEVERRGRQLRRPGGGLRRFQRQAFELEAEFGGRRRGQAADRDGLRQRLQLRRAERRRQREVVELGRRLEVGPQRQRGAQLVVEFVRRRRFVAVGDDVFPRLGDLSRAQPG